MPNAETGPGGHGFDATPQLTSDYSRRDLIDALIDLRFPKALSLATVRLDREVRDYLVSRLSERR
jgi:hypothetical protein